ncbi:MAG: GDP-mannose 4,6-dehydratase [Anaerolineae bacterium]
MRALITGIAGFAGSHLAEHLLAQTDWEVWGVVHRRDENIAHLRPQLHLLQGDLTDGQWVREMLREVRPDLIFHLAAQSHVPLSWQDPWGTLETNIRAQVNLLQGVVQLNLEPRILIVGSNEEYGLIAPQELPVKETNPLRPDSPYGVSKVAQDLLGLQYHLSHGLQTVRVRPFNHIGPRQREHFVAPAFAKQIAEIEAGLTPPIVRVGNLSPQRDFTDVRDMVRAYHLALSLGEAGEVYNIGSGQPRSVQELLDTLLGLSQTAIRVEQDPARFRPSDVPISYCDASKFHARTGWQPQIPFEQSLRDVLDYWREKVRARR